MITHFTHRDGTGPMTKQIEYEGETYQYDEVGLKLFRADGSEVLEAMEVIHIVSEWEREQEMEL